MPPLVDCRVLPQLKCSQIHFALMFSRDEIEPETEIVDKRHKHCTVTIAPSVNKKWTIINQESVPHIDFLLFLVSFEYVHYSINISEVK